MQPSYDCTVGSKDRHMHINTIHVGVCGKDFVKADGLPTRLARESIRKGKESQSFSLPYLPLTVLNPTLLGNHKVHCIHKTPLPFPWARDIDP